MTKKNCTTRHPTTSGVTPATTGDQKESTFTVNTSHYPIQKNIGKHLEWVVLELYRPKTILKTEGLVSYVHRNIHRRHLQANIFW
jgi:hypothetical protein